MSTSEFVTKYCKVLARFVDVDFSKPDVSKVWGEYGEYQLVGRGEKTNEHCGAYLGMRGCLNVEKHNKKTLDGVDHSGKIYGKFVFRWCHKPSCPTCYEHGWAYREARKAEARLLEAKKSFGLIQHMSVSIPVSGYGGSLEACRKKAVKALRVRGVIGGCIINHAFRYNSPEEARLKHCSFGWYWSPHFHILGFIEGGYGRCRGCKRLCDKCDGFEGRTRRHFAEDGVIVKVFGERKSIVGTLFYQLNHCTIEKGVKRPHPLTWFGVVSYRKFKFTYERHVDVCPICKSETVPIKYVGSELGFVTDRSSPDFKPEFEANLFEGSGVAWIEKPCVRRYGGGRYEG